MIPKIYEATVLGRHEREQGRGAVGLFVGEPETILEFVAAMHDVPRPSVYLTEKPVKVISAEMLRKLREAKAELQEAQGKVQQLVKAF